MLVDRTPDFIKVPSCKQCNQETSDLDFNFKVQMGLYIGEHVPAFWLSTQNSLNKTISKKSQKWQMLSEMEEVWRPPFAKPFLYSLRIKKEPINLSVKKIIRGLYWFLKGEMLPIDTQINIKFLKQNENTHANLDVIFKQYGETLSISNNGFQATYAICEDETKGSLWKLSFYGVECFLVTTT